MATNMNMARKPSLGEYVPNNMPIDYNNMSMNKTASGNYAAATANMPLPQNAIGEAAMGNQGPGAFPQNHFNQVMNNFGGQTRQFQDSLENMARMKYNPNSNMAASGQYGGLYDSSSSESYQLAMARKFRPQDMYGMSKNMEQSSIPQQRNMASNPWPSTDYGGRINNRQQRTLPTNKAGMPQQGRVDPNLGPSMPPDQNFPSPAAGASSQQPYQLPSPYMTADMFKQSREQPFAGQGMGGNFNPQDFYQQEQLRQMANQYQPAQHPHAASNYLAASQRNSSSPFGQPVMPKPSQDAMYSQPFGGSPKSNGPHSIMPNMVDERQMPFPNTNFPVSPVGSQMAGKPGFAQSIGIRGTVSPNVTIGMPKKPQYRPQEEAVTSPGANQNAAAAAAAAAVLAAVNTANPGQQSDIHNISRPPSVPMIPSRPPSIHAKDPRSPATSIISDHKSESGGSGVNDIRATPSPARSLSRNTPQLAEPSAVMNFPADIETGRVPSPQVNQLPSSDIEAMIQSVSNIPGGAVPDQSTATLRSKPDSISEAASKSNQGSALSPVTPPSPFSLSPSINVDFDIGMLSPSWEDSSARSATPLGKLYKLSDEPERKEFLDKLVSLMEQHGKVLNDVPHFNGCILDLYKFYQLVLKRGGMQEVTRLKLWKEVGQCLTNAAVTPSNEDEQVLRELYVRFLLIYEEKVAGPPLLPSANLHPPNAPPNSNPPTNNEPGNIDLSTMTYKNLFQANSNAPTPPYSQGSAPAMQPPSYPNTPPSTQAFPSTPPMQQHPGYRNAPGYAQTSSGFPGYPQGSPRVPSYPPGHPGYSNHQYAGNFQGPPPSQMPGYHNGMVPSRYPNYPHSTVPPEAMYGQFPRGPAMNKPFQHDPQSQAMFPNYQQQGQHQPGYMYSQQASNMAAYQMERQRAAQRGGMGSPRPRMQSPWGQRYQDGAGTSSGSPSPFHNSQSPGLKSSRPPPPYPHPKQEKPSPTSQSAAAALQYQAMKAGVKLPSVKKEEELFPAGCVESTQAVHTKKRRLTARDIGPVEAWRIMMSLKSGLLTETAWALDTLTILLSDDATVGFFRLSHLPGFLDTVVEHFRRNMINVFDVLRENEIETGMAERFAYGKSNDTEDQLFGDVLPDQIATENFTSIIVTSCLTDDEERGFCGGVKDWSSGGGDTTMHIQTHFETDPGFYEFPRKDSDGEKAGISENTNQDKSVDSSVAEIEKNEVSKGFENMDAEKESTTSGPEQLNEHQNVDTEEFNSLYNGIPSPDAKRLKKSVITADSDVLVKKEVSELLDWERKQTCCNGKEDGPTECECDPAKTEHGSSVDKVELASSVDELESETSPAKIEPDSSVEHDPSSLLIKKLKTEFDLDVEVLGKDSEERPSSLTSCDMSPATPADSECELKQEFPLCSLTLSQDSAISTCNCVSNIIRNLSFVPGNDVEMAKNPALLLILAKLLLLYHMKRKKGIACDSQYNDSESWWQDCLDMVRENTLVTIANIAGYLDLSPLAGNVSRLLLDGLLHWLVCESAVADEPLRSTSASVVLTPKQLVLETLAKMSVLESNVDFILSSPDKPRLAKAYEYLVKLFSDKTNEVTREFALVLLSSFTQANQEICSANSERNLVTVLVGFLEDARDRVESMAVRGLHPGMFRDNDLRVSMGMLRRAGGLLACIAKRTRSTHLIPFQERVLDLSMSRALDAEVQSHLSNVLYNLPR